MRRDDNVVFLGEDVAEAGGVFKTTVGLLDEFGPDRVRDTPISEQAILGAAMGAAMTGLRPIAEIMFSDFFAVCWDIVANEIAKSSVHDRRSSHAAARHPVRQRRRRALRRTALAERGELGDGDARPEGRRAVYPGRRDGLDGRRDPRPRPRAVLRAQGAVRDEGRGARRRDRDRSATANVLREGSDVTIVALAAMVPRALEAAGHLERSTASRRP